MSTNTSKAPDTGDEHPSPSMQNLLRKLLEQELKRPAGNVAQGGGNALIGRLEDFDESGYPIVVFEHHGTPCTRSARSTVELSREQLGRECLIQLCGGPETPVIAGLIQPPLREPAADEPAILRTDDSIRLQCGEAYIELTAEGTVRIRGDYVESVAYGANRLKGSSVKIN